MMRCPSRTTVPGLSSRSGRTTSAPYSDHDQPATIASRAAPVATACSPRSEIGKPQLLCDAGWKPARELLPNRLEQQVACVGDRGHRSTTISGSMSEAMFAIAMPMYLRGLADDRYRDAVAAACALEHVRSR